MKLRISFYILLLVLSAWSCKNSNSESSSQDEVLISFSDYENDKDITYMFYKDSLSLSDIIPDYDRSKEYVCGNKEFEIKDEKIYLRNPNALNKPKVTLILTDKNDQAKQYKRELRIRSWIKGHYYIKKVEARTSVRLQKTYDKATYFVQLNQLYLAQYDMKNIRQLGLVSFGNTMYNELVVKDGLMAIRSAGRIYVSDNFRNFNLIFDGLRAIKESMVITKNDKGEYELLFSEYSPELDFVRHHIRCYNFASTKLSVRQVFYKTEEYENQGLAPHARHIHILKQDPYTGYIFVGTGDRNDGSSAIYYSKDNCKTLIRLGTGSQSWRTLFFIFTEKSVFWGMDASSTQYLCRLNRADLPDKDANQSPMMQFPLINSALWALDEVKMEDGKTMNVVSSNNEGGLYDDYCRTYGIIIENEEPIIYELNAYKARNNIHDQLYPMGVDNQQQVLMQDLITREIGKYKLVRYKNK